MERFTLSPDQDTTIYQAAGSSRPYRELQLDDHATGCRVVVRVEADLGEPLEEAIGWVAERLVSPP
jgi:hypothetical protein